MLPGWPLSCFLREASPLVYLWSFSEILTHCLQNSIKFQGEVAGLNPHSRNLSWARAGVCTSGQGPGPLSPKPPNAEHRCKGLLLIQHALHSGQDQEVGLASALRPTQPSRLSPSVTFDHTREHMRAHTS